MPRWIQKIDENGKSHFVPADEAARKIDGVAIHGPIEPFVSPIDGTVISDRRQYREHCSKHGVVPAAEFDQKYYDERAKERERLSTGQFNKKERFVRRQTIYEAVIRAEREAGWT